MKTAVVYYSLNGNCAFVAEEIKAGLNSDLIRLHTKDEKDRKGCAKFFWSIKVMLSKKPPLKPYTFDPSMYDLIIIGAPVWAGSPASPVKTFISESGIKGKKIALFVCHAGGMGNALGDLTKLLSSNDIISEMDINDPKTKDSEGAKQMIAQWVKTLG